MFERNVAVIGARYWGKNLVRNFHELGVLKTVCNGAQGICQHVQKSYPGIDVTSDPDAVLNDLEIKAVVIAAPVALHYALAEKPCEQP